jgi:hypothetical protein
MSTPLWCLGPVFKKGQLLREEKFTQCHQGMGLGVHLGKLVPSFAYYRLLNASFLKCICTWC